MTQTYYNEQTENDPCEDCDDEDAPHGDNTEEEMDGEE